MPDYLARLRSVLSGSYLRSDRAPSEVKFTPADSAQDWTYVQHLVMTANADPLKPSEQGDGNSAVFACLRALALASLEPPLHVYQVATDGEETWLPTHPWQKFLDRPNPWLNILELRFWTTWAKHLDGNAYLLKVRAGDRTSGNVVELWPVSPTRMQPWTEKGSPNFIDGYKLRLADGKTEVHPVENVIHFKFGIDDRDPRRGMSPLKRLVREVASDGEATRFQDALTRNFGIPGLLVTVPALGPGGIPIPQLTPEAALKLKDGITQAYGTDNRGGVGLLTGGADMKQFGFTPEQMNLEALHSMPETRICAVMGVDPLIARLTVGLQQTSNYASARQVRENFTENTLVPMWRMDELKWTESLHDDFTSDESIVVHHHLEEVRALQEDTDALWLRVTNAFKANMLKPEAVEALLDLTPGSVPEPVAPEPPQTPPPPTGTPAPPTGASRNGLSLKSSDFDRWPDIMAGMVELATPGFEEDFNQLMDSIRKRVKRELLSGDVG